MMASDYPEPLNLGQDGMVTINKLVDWSRRSLAFA